MREIARAIGRDPGTVSRELRRNAATRGGKPVYRAVVALQHPVECSGSYTALS